MSASNFHSFQCVLQDTLHLEDQAWDYQVTNLPGPGTLNAKQLMKSITVTSTSDKQQILLRLQPSSPNRAIAGHSLDKFLSISFADFRLRVPASLDPHAPSETKPATARESTDYITRLLRAGVTLNSIRYNFYGHSNSQLKSRACFLFADTKEEIDRMIEGLGDFTKMNTVAKKSKRIGLLFSVARTAIVLNPSRCQDIPDIETKDFIFTDGCGLISPQLAQDLARRIGIKFRNLRYTPSVIQIRYRGYKGVLMLDRNMKGDVQAKFRKSMKKFSGGDDLSFSVVDYSKVSFPKSSFVFRKSHEILTVCLILRLAVRLRILE